MSICDSFSLRLPPSRLPGHEHEATGFFSAEYLDTFVLDKKNQNTDTLQPAHHIPSPVSGAFTVGAVFFWLPRIFLLLQESQRASASCGGVWQLEGKEDV